MLEMRFPTVLVLCCLTLVPCEAGGAQTPCRHCGDSSTTAREGLGSHISYFPSIHWPYTPTKPPSAAVGSKEHSGREEKD